MKRRILILGSVAVVFVLAILWWLNRSTPALPPTPPAITARPTPTGIKPAPPAPSRLPLTYQVPGKGKYQGLSDPRWKWWNEMEKKDPSFEWKIPINFYGKVVDQDGHPIAGAKVRYGWNDTAGSHERFDKSDANGLFSLTGIIGKIVSVRVENDGYHAGSESFGSYEYAAFFESNYYEADPNNPAIFRLTKKIDAEPLTEGNAFNSLSYDQGTYYYDLQRRTISRQPPVGEGLKFTITRSQAAQGQPFDWMWKVEGINTAVLVTADEFPQLAPTDGYVSSWKIEQKADAERFQREGKVRLYLHTVGNHYGRVDLQLSHPNAREIGPTLGVKSYLNPSGSRNLESP